MSETVDTSSKEVIRPHLQSEQSIQYDDQFPERDWLLRYDIPYDMANKVGIRWNENFFVYPENDSLIFSCLPLQNDNDYFFTPKLLSKYLGDPRSKLLHLESDNVYTLIPRDLSPFEEGDTVEYTYISETEGEERHIKVNRHGRES